MVGDSVYDTSTCTVGDDLIIPTTPPTKYGYTFNGWKLTNYTPIEYLESTGTQWIDTGISGGEYTKIVLDFQLVEYGYTILAGTGSADTQYSNYIFANPRYQDFGFFVKGVFTYGIETDLQRHIFIYNDSSYYYMDNTSMDLGLPGFDGNSIGLFASLHNGKAIRPTKAKLYSCKLYNNNGLVRSFIPVLDTNGTPCLFDKIESKFYYSQGTGNFIAGPVLN